MIDLLKWDSDFFGFQVGRSDNSETLAPDQLLKKAKDLGFKLIYLFLEKPVNPGFTNQACKFHEFNLMEEKVIFIKEINRNSPLPSTNVSVCDQNEFSKYKERFYELGVASGHYSRFLHDSHIPTSKFRELYRRWVDNGINNQSSNIIYSQNENSISGFVTLDYEKSHTNIGLFAVSEEFRRKGIGQLLMKKIETLTSHRKLNKIQVTTQRQNKMACNFYQKLSFLEKTSFLTYHIWL